MPHWERKRHPYNRPYSLGQAADDGLLLVVRCVNCRRTLHFLAADLLQFYERDRPAEQPPFSCSRCKTDQFVRVSPRLPDPGDYGSLLIRRPAEVVQIQKWKTVRLGDEAAPATRPVGRYSNR